MSKSDIVFQIQYKNPKNKKQAITKWMNYACQKQKADPSNIDQYNLLKDYALYNDKETFLTEMDETFMWNKDGDLLKKDVILKLKDMNKSGFFWRGFLSFPSDFANEHRLITKSDFYSLSNNVFPNLIMDMGLDLNNVEWMCTLHRDTNHPHIHFCIYEKKDTISNHKVPLSCIHKFKRNVASSLTNYQQFYELRDKAFSNITGTIKAKELNKIKSQRLFSDSYRKGLNKLLINFYKELPEKGRIQYNSKNMLTHKKEMDAIIEYILMHDSVKYEYAKYLRLLEEHQKEINNLYGLSNSNKSRKYYNDQLNRLYTKIGNEILYNYKKYQSLDFIDREKIFLQKHINEFNFKSRKDYAKKETKLNIAKNLYKICMLAGLNDYQTKKVISRWIKNSGYDFKVDEIFSSIVSLDIDMSVTELYNSMKKLGYDYDKYNKIKDKYFYRELNYKRFINKAINHLMYELELEEKQIVDAIQFEMEEDYKR